MNLNHRGSYFAKATKDRLQGYAEELIDAYTVMLLSAGCTGALADFSAEFAMMMQK